MGYSLGIVLAATWALSVARIHGHPSQYAIPVTPVVGAQSTQNQCPKLKPLKFQANAPIDQIKNWSVVKVTALADTSSQNTASSNAQLQERFCGLFSDGNNCVGISYTVTDLNAQSFSMQTFAYDGKNPSLATATKTFYLADSQNQVWSVNGGVNQVQTVTTGYSEAAQSQDLTFAALAENAKGAWKMFGLCDATMLWVVAPADALKADSGYLNNYKTEIDMALQQIKSGLSMVSGTGTHGTQNPVSLGGDPLPIVAIFGGPPPMVSGVTPPPMVGVPGTIPPPMISTQHRDNNVVTGENYMQQVPPNSALAYATIGSQAQPSTQPPPAVLASNTGNTDTPSFVIQQP